MFKFKPAISFLVLFILFNSPTVSAAFIYDESISGDLSSTDIGTLTTESIIKGSLDGGATSNPMDGSDEKDAVIFTIRADGTKPITIELTGLSLRRGDEGGGGSGGGSGASDELKVTLTPVPSSGLPNTVIIRPAAEEVYARRLSKNLSI